MLHGGARAAVEPQTLCVTYLGNAGWEISDARHVVLVDPYVSQFREPRASHPNGPDSADDIATPDEHGIDAHIHAADYILITHGHLDHLLDAPYIAVRTGANIIGSVSVINISRARSVPEQQLIAVKGGEDYQFDGLSLRVIPSLHTPLFGKHYGSLTFAGSTLAGHAPQDLKPPLRESAYVEGGTLAYLLRMDGHRILITGTMNFIERELQGLMPDIAIVGAGPSRKESYRYAQRVMGALNDPPLVLPTHWDSWDSKSLNDALRNVREFAAEIRTASPRSKVVIPEYFKPMAVGSGGHLDGSCTQR
jgi:L-ascorbate metabolism protein UlaG (beta-lactamase superfamily)